jgi:hypothetical protein
LEEQSSSEEQSPEEEELLLSEEENEELPSEEEEDEHPGMGSQRKFGHSSHGPQSDSVWHVFLQVKSTQISSGLQHLSPQQGSSILQKLLHTLSSQYSHSEVLQTKPPQHSAGLLQNALPPSPMQQTVSDGQHSNFPSDSWKQQISFSSHGLHPNMVQASHLEGSQSAASQQTSSFSMHLPSRQHRLPRQ